MAKQVTDLKTGDRIEINCGCMYGSEQATVVGIDSDRFYFYAEIVKDDGETDRIYGAETLRGIGWKQVERVAA